MIKRVAWITSFAFGLGRGLAELFYNNAIAVEASAVHPTHNVDLTA